ncbi:MAG: M48 family metallopeptidase [Thermoleophilaceae bacterium]|nr:M48 family metallopeptidase [Thermoleophilaceae bacterium]
MSAIPYRIRRSPRARRARILVDGEGVEVVVPRRFPLREVEPLVRDKRGWIERTLRRIEAAREEFPPPRLEPGGELPYLGERLALDVRAEPARRLCRVTRRDGTLQVVLGGEALRDAVESWYRRQARREIGVRLDAATARAGTGYTTLSIRGQRTRWASCSSNGAMSFNYCLLLAPAEILDYVVEHEVAHLEVRDHSPRFWALLASRCPRWREREDWLRRHGQALRL